MMYEDKVLKSAAKALVERQDDPEALFEDLRAVKQDHENLSVPEDQQRYELKLELDAKDFGTIMAEVERLVAEAGDAE